MRTLQRYTASEASFAGRRLLNIATLHGSPYDLRCPLGHGVTPWVSDSISENGCFSLSIAIPLALRLLDFRIGRTPNSFILQNTIATLIQVSIRHASVQWEVINRLIFVTPPAMLVHVTIPYQGSSSSTSSTSSRSAYGARRSTRAHRFLLPRPPPMLPVISTNMRG